MPDSPGAAGAASQNRPHSDVAPVGAGPLSALIIDSSREMRNILRSLVADLGFATLEADDDLQALDHLTAGRVPTLCLIAWTMPVLDGYTFLTRIRANPVWRDITVMMVTTENEHSQIIGTLAAGEHPYAIEPLTPARLAAKLHLRGILPVA